MPADEPGYVYSRDGGGEWTENRGLLPQPAGQTTPAPPAPPASTTFSWTLKVSCAALCAMTIGIAAGAAMQAHLQSKMLHRPGQVNTGSSASADSAEQALRAIDPISSTGIPTGLVSGHSTQQTMEKGTKSVIATSTNIVSAPASTTSLAATTTSAPASTTSLAATTTNLTTTAAVRPRPPRAIGKKKAASNNIEHSSSVDGTMEEEGSGKPPYVKHFYMYRVQNDEDYSPENQNMANIGGALWYLHNEIIFHHWNRGGTYASTPKTRIERFEVKTRATHKLYKRGMNFGVVNTYDLGQCSGPFKCENLKEYGPVIGCEMWEQGENLKYNNTFPHQQWVGKNIYPNAMWYSLPGACSSTKFWHQQGQCSKSEPSGACPPGVTPTGKKDCTYTYKKVGELRISDLEEIKSFNDLVVKGGREYDRDTDAGVNMHFWDHINSTLACQERIDKVSRMFVDKFPYQKPLEDPLCDFDVMKFYPNFPRGDFQHAD